LCPDADLPSGQSLVLSIDGVEIQRVSTYRINCTTSAGTCELVLSGAAGSESSNVDAWYQSAAQGDPTATRNFTLAVSDSSGTTIRRFFATNGRPTALLNQGDRFQLTFKADNIRQIAA
jgi:hypothetical protein